ncbi:rod shape-determining protein MreD [Bacillus sp. DNRA2]|uniref:rod shape-determining protein MreD n=1 Tax=Bacillus sp. DNRA2 TaxID=2723053 RepID=UPI00145CE5C0|nr:rod shape-determining protein MreD [Bacillus sp. DNRA2]
MRTFLLPVLFTACFIFESIFLELTPGKYLHHDNLFVPHLLMIALILLTIYGNRNYGIMYGFIFGLLFDVIYIEIIGIYMVVFPIVCYLISKIMKVLQTNLIIVTFVTLIGVALLEVSVYYMSFLIHRTDMVFSTFLHDRLIPTIILNLVLTIIFAYPLKRHFEKLADQLRNE